MSITDYVISLQEMPEYEQGWNAYLNHEPRRAPSVLRGDRALAYLWGWDSAKLEEANDESSEE